MCETTPRPLTPGHAMICHQLEDITLPLMPSIEMMMTSHAVEVRSVKHALAIEVRVRNADSVHVQYIHNK